jgi:hypothetical protein
MSLRRRFLLKTTEVVTSIFFLVAAWFLVQSSEWWPLGILFVLAGVSGLFRVFSGKTGFTQDAATPAKEDTQPF